MTKATVLLFEYQEMPWWYPGISGTSGTIYNAPRSLSGSSVWTAEFRHGVFYSHVRDDDPAADWLHERCKEAGGVPVRMVPDTELDLYRAHIESIVGPTDCDADELRQSLVNAWQNGRWSFPWEMHWVYCGDDVQYIAPTAVAAIAAARSMGLAELYVSPNSPDCKHKAVRWEAGRGTDQVRERDLEEERYQAGFGPDEWACRP